MRLGVASQGEAQSGDAGNVLSDGTFRFNLITRNRILLEAAYRGSWIVGRIVDCRAQDMTKSGIILTTNEGAERLQDFKVQYSRLQIWQRINDATKWGRLYGGALGVFQIEGQDLETPLDPETIEQGQFRGIAVYDRWQLNPVLSEIIEEGPDIGLPAYYDIVLGNNMNQPAQVPGDGSQSNASKMTGQTAGGPNSYGRVRVHHSRCFRMGGHKLPFFQAITEMMWDESVIERMWDRLIEFETATASVGGLIGRALLRTVGIENLREILAAGGEAKSGLLEMFEYMRQFQTSEGLTLLDKNDTFATTAYSFAGLSDILERFGEQLSGAGDTPLTRLFGQSPGGLNSNGEADTRNYYDSINSSQESDLRNPVELINKVLWRSTFGEAAPKDLSFVFTPLWQMSAKEKAEITALNTNSIHIAHEDGLISTSTAMKELKQASADTGVFTNISDEEIEQAENEPPPIPELEEKVSSADPASRGEAAGDPGGNPVAPPEKVKKQGVNKDSASFWSRLFGKKPTHDFIRKKKGKYVVYSHKGKELGEYASKQEAEKRLRQIEYFKNQDSKPKSKTSDQKAIERWIKKKM